MDDNALEIQISAANGEAIFAGINVAALWGALVRKGLIEKSEAVAILDGILLMLEESPPKSSLHAPSFAYARRRAEALLKEISAQPDGDGQGSR